MSNPHHATQPAFEVKTEVFEGPLELLISLVEKRKLLINDISLTEVTDEYMAHVSRMQAASLPGTAQFVELAATLLLLKSKSLLPHSELSIEESQHIDELKDRLQYYQIFRDAGHALAKQYGKRRARRRTFRPHTTYQFTPDEWTEKEALRRAAETVIAALPFTQPPQRAAVTPQVTIEDMRQRLHDILKDRFEISMFELVQKRADHTEILTGFLALLESLRRAEVSARQHVHFGDIRVTKEQLRAPNYS